MDCFILCEFDLVAGSLLVVNSYQDHMRKAGDVCFAQVFRDGDGMSCLLKLSIGIPGIFK